MAMLDFCVVGGGIVGLATTRALRRRFPEASIVVLEKETAVARHQTGRNSGVIHAGIYYKPGSLKAEMCRRGAAGTRAFCDEHGIAYETRGKLVVATHADQLGRLRALAETARANSIPIEILDATELRRREPAVRGVGAIHVASSGIVDYRQVAQAMAADLIRRGCEIRTGVRIDRIREDADGVSVGGSSGGDAGAEWRARRLIVCAGLQSDRLARLAGFDVPHRIVPFRGEYFDVRAPMRNAVRHLIYPVPDPRLPFLGIHLTPTIDGRLTAGPNAVLGFAREGYRRLSIAPHDLTDTLGFAGFWRLAARNWRAGLEEVRNSLSKARFLAACRIFCPDLSLADLQPVEAGIRAQAVLRDGSMVQDFLFLQTARMVHVCNAPSPAATAAIPIGESIADRCL